MNLDELQSIQSKERQKDSLQNLRPSFYREVGEYIRSRLRDLQSTVPDLVDVRGEQPGPRCRGHQGPSKRLENRQNDRTLREEFDAHVWVPLNDGPQVVELSEKSLVTNRYSATAGTSLSLDYSIALFLLSLVGDETTRDGG
jgi:hypothetical protein